MSEKDTVGRKIDEQAGEDKSSVSCPRNSLLHSWFTPTNRRATYKKIQKIGFFCGFISFIISVYIGRKNLKSDDFFIQYIFVPLMSFGVFYLVVNIYRYISKVHRLKKRESKNDISRGAIESIINFIASFMFVYYFLHVIFIVFNITK